MARKRKTENGKSKTGFYGPKARPVNARQKALIHVAKSQVGMEEEAYRELLAGFGVESSAGLNQGQFDELMRHFEKLGFVYRHRPKTKGAPEIRRQAEDKKALMTAIGGLLKAWGRSWAYADGMARQMFGVYKAVWLPLGKLDKLFQALKVDERRRERRGETAAEIMDQMRRDLEEIQG